MENFKEKISSIFLKNNIKLSPLQLEQFDLYYKLLIEWNQKFNLTAITDEDEVIKKHFLDSVVCSNLFKKDAKIVDIGAGAGFPSVPLKVLRPDLSVLMVDAVNKKVLFLQELISKLKLENISTIHSRAEDLASKQDFREQFDICVSRAVAPFSTLVEYCLPFVRIGGQMFAYKATNANDELKLAEKAINILGGKYDRQEAYSFEGLTRKVVVVSKVKQTPNKFPRGANKPRLAPIS